MDNRNVKSAFEILIDEIKNVMNELNKKTEIALKNQNYEKAGRIIEVEKKINEFSEKVKKLKTEWNKIFDNKLSDNKYNRKELAKLNRGLKTSQNKFRIPLLESLVELGGKAKMKDVLNLLENKMRNQFNKYDLEGLPSDPKQKRWQNTAQ
ncbi:MAG: hypothetical protein N2249_01425, partial [Melioribacter sp.]|nr:hypothetical protein [Melioribacter sp.]